jgi:hypothetical protein
VPIISTANADANANLLRTGNQQLTTSDWKLTIDNFERTAANIPLNISGGRPFRRRR